MLQPGNRVGRYEIQAIVGEGGFGKVYRAWDPEFERLVAIKELSSERQGDESANYAEYRERFKLERRVQGQFQHPRIVSVYDLVQQDGNEYLVEQFVEGGTLRAVLDQEGRLRPERVVEIGIEMCQAIAAIWENDIVHRDIKPSNILLTGDDHAKLSDFGVAQVGRLSQRTQSDTRHPGSPAYMSPEQERGGGYLDERSDLYSLGLVLYEALTGKSYKRERVLVRQLAPDLPKGLETAVMRALAQNPADRYPSPAEFETALRRAQITSQPTDRKRPAWAWWGVGFISLALIASGWLTFRSSSQSLALPTLTVTLLSSQMLPADAPAPAATPVALTPTSAQLQMFTATASPTPSATLNPTVTPAPSATLNPTVTPTPKLLVTPSAPQLVSPPGAGWTCSSRQTLKWEGRLPDSSYGFRASLRHIERGLSYVSPILDNTQWTVDVPADAAGEWRWSVAAVRRSSESDLTRSDEWTFYYTPFCSSISPVATPQRNP
jgi:serine/threonine protein kinase